jgi:O-antigen/teichoic acid export membrane protein
MARSGFWINLNVVVAAAGSLLVAVACANLLPAETFGRYQYLLSFSTIIGAVTLTGMNYAVTQAVARGYDGILRESVKMQLRWSLIPVVAGACIGAYYLLNGNSELGYGLIAIGVGVPIIYTFNTYVAFLNGKKAFRQTFIYGSVLNAAYYGSILLAVFFLPQALLLLLVHIVVNALVTTGLYLHTLRKYQPNDSVDPADLVYGKHLSVMYVPSLIVRQLDAVLVFQVLGPVQLAVYTFASAIPERLSGLFKAVFTAALPRFSEQSQRTLRSSLFSKMVWVTLAGFAVAGIYMLAAPLVFSLLFPAYMDAVPYSQVAALAIAAAASNISVPALVSQRLQRELYLFYVITPFVQLAIQAGLLLTYGLWGLIIGRILSSFLDTAVSTALFYGARERHSFTASLPV